jgi:hypothetical protein
MQANHANRTACVLLKESNELEPCTSLSKDIDEAK